MHILVINAGSSSIKFSIFNAPTPESDPTALLDGELSAIGTTEAKLRLGDTDPKAVAAKSPEEAIHLIFDALAGPDLPAIDAVGYRVVHPGPKLDRHQRITADVLSDLEQATAFAPLHEPEAVALIRAAMVRFPKIPHFACFDTIFHQTMPESASTYPIPLAYRAKGVRRYGFHGLSCESIVRQLHAANINPPRMIVAHLGSGCSVTTIVDGKSVDTTMGLTPTGGIVMGTRPGDLDPGLILFLLREPGASVDSVEHLLNHDSGIKALFGINDMRTLRQKSDQPAAALALEIFTNSLRRAIGGMGALHGPIDAIVFTGGIGEHDAKTRWSTGNALFLDQPKIDPAANDAQARGLRKISTPDSAIAVYVVPAEEDPMIAVHVAHMMAEQPAPM